MLMYTQTYLRLRFFEFLNQFLCEKCNFFTKSKPENCIRPQGCKDDMDVAAFMNVRNAVFQLI